jgi:hypothetical protein
MKAYGMRRKLCSFNEFYSLILSLVFIVIANHYER